jgi:hypothetical protein
MNGTVGGVSLSVADAIFAVLRDGTGKQAGLLVAMSDKPNICDSLKANRQPKSATALTMAFVRYNAQFETLAPDVGEYSVLSAEAPGAGNFAAAVFSRSDANCTNTISNDASVAKSGLIKLTNLKAETNGTAVASFDMTFGAGDKVTGSFNARYCDIVSLSTTAPNCE